MSSGTYLLALSLKLSAKDERVADARSEPRACGPLETSSLVSQIWKSFGLQTSNLFDFMLIT